MTCMEVWGGSQLTTRGVEIGGLDAWVYSKPFGDAERGGDVYYASSCATGRITRLLLADVSGHGNSVASTAANLRTLMRRFVNRLDQTEFVRLLNQQFAALSEAGTFATAVVTTFFAPTQRLIICNAGHPRPLLYRASKQEWTLLGAEATAEAPSPNNMPLGIIDITEYEQFDVELESGDCVLSYTDASDRVPRCRWRDAGRSRSAADPASARRCRAATPDQDAAARDQGSISGQSDRGRRDGAPRPSQRAQAAAFVQEISSGRISVLSARLIRAINPWAERPPLPDFNVANIGGAIIPALEQRWRATGSTHRPHTECRKVGRASDCLPFRAAR